ncbi:MAG: HEAT repeat domain-containing protein, partial [Myxococcales bacterium]|nr:HEAT repeat domain-containing protein [Myxococcales bacterium]
MSDFRSRLTLSKEDAARVHAVEQLAVDGAASVATLVAQLDDASWAVRRAVVGALARLGAPAVAPLVDVLRMRRDSEARLAAAVDALSSCRAEVDAAMFALVDEAGRPAVVCDAVQVLGRRRSVAAVPLLERLTAHADDNVAVAAIEALGRIGGGAGVTTLVAARCLASADPVEQVAICQVLGWLRAAEGVRPLFSLLGAAAPVAQAAAAALRQLGRTIDEQLAAALRDADSDARLQLLPLAAGNSGLDEIVACLADADPAVRHAACAALARCGDPSAVAALFARLGDEDGRVAQAATAAIQSLGSSKTERLALDAARSPNLQVRRAGLRIIAYFGYAAGLDALLSAAEESDDRLRDAAIAGLAFVDDPRAADALLVASRHASAKTRAATARALGQLAGDLRAPSALRSLLADGDAWVRYYACQSLGKLRDRAAADALVALLDDPAGQVRVAVVEALSQLQTDGALAALQAAARSDDGDMQRAAIVGLGLRKRMDALPVLVDAAASADAATRLVALSALADFDAPQAIAALRRAAVDSDESVRIAAVEHLATRKG